MYWRDGPGFGLSENFCFFNGADAFYGENLFRCEYRWRKSLQEQRILGSLFSENSFDRKEKAYRPHGRTYTCATAPMSRPSCRMGLPDMPCTMSPVFCSRRSFVTRSTILRWGGLAGHFDDLNGVFLHGGAVCCLFWVLSWFKRLFPLCIARKHCLQKETF